MYQITHNTFVCLSLSYWSLAPNYILFLSYVTFPLRWLFTGCVPTSTIRYIQEAPHCRTYTVSVRLYTKFGNICWGVRLTVPPWSKEEAQALCIWIYSECLWIIGGVCLEQTVHIEARRTTELSMNRQQGYLQNARTPAFPTGSSKYRVRWPHSLQHFCTVGEV